MKSQRKRQIMTLSILVVAVLVISVGFAAFSTTLRISSSATVNPDSGTFAVKFSTTKDTLTVAAVAPSSNASGLTATNGVIDNSSNPTISNLSAEFKNPGDEVVYTFYARNEGEYTAYLNNINFNGAKACTAKEGATASLVSDACNGISVSVSVAGTSYSATTPITGHSLVKSVGEEIKVTLKYDSNATRADGPFTVSLPEITMVYSTIDDPTFEPPKACALTDSDSSGGASLSDVVTCGTESFYVVDSSDGNVNMLAAENITVDLVSPTQSSTAGTVVFASSEYWLNGEYSSAGDSGYVYVYDSNSNVYPYVEAYRDVLEGMGVNVIDAKLLSYEQVKKLGCEGTLCSSMPTWVFKTSFYTGSVSDSSIGYIYGEGESGFFMSADMSTLDPFGIRPVITISESELG